jgi:hypothetical protein
MAQSIYAIKEEVVVFLRNQDIISTSVRGVTTTTDNFTAGVAQTTFTLTHTNVKNIRSVTKNAASQRFGFDYTVNYQTAVVTISSAAVGDTIAIQYDYGVTDKIFPDFPQAYLKRSDFPRIAVDYTPTTTRELQLGGQGNISAYFMDVAYYAESRQDIDTKITAIKTAIMANKKNWYNVDFITPSGFSPVLQSPFGEQKIYQRSIMLSLPDIIELS